MYLLASLLKRTVKKGECLEWTGCLNSDGYPRAALNGNLNTKVHRVVKQLTTKENIEGKVVRHTCDNPKCINPDHLLLGSNLDNIRDRVERGRTFKRITKEKISEIHRLISEGRLNKKEIADIVGVDPRRVSDVSLGKYADDSTFLRH